MPSKAEVILYFASIARRYDLMNHLLSFNVDRRWRRRLLRESGVHSGGRVLDVCTGTCDILIDFYRACPTCELVGVDATEPMLDIGHQKLEKIGADGCTKLLCADALDLPLEDASFDIATMGFGLRNLEDPRRGLKEMHRVLKPGGRVLILEFAPVPRGPFGWLYKVYLNGVVPCLGGLMTGSFSAYRHLSTSIQDFFFPEYLVGLMKTQEFKEIRAIPLFGKIAFIYVGVR